MLPALRAARGTVVFLNSGAGLVAHPEWSAYAASKFGLRAVADSLRAEEAGAGVRVTSVYLGRIATPMQQKVHEQEGKDYDPGDWVVAGIGGRDDPARARPAAGRHDPGHHRPAATSLTGWSPEVASAPAKAARIR